MPAVQYKSSLKLASPAGSATLPVLQIAAAATKPLIVQRLEITNESSVTSAVGIAELVRSTATAPGTLSLAAGRIIKLDPSFAAAGFALTDTGFSGALTGTQETIGRWGFNILNGFLYLPTPEEQFEIAAGGFLWVRLVPTVPTATYDVDVVVTELG
jgi:hypothetical protein